MLLTEHELNERVEPLLEGLGPELQLNPCVPECTRVQRDEMMGAIRKHLETIALAAASCNYRSQDYERLFARLDEITVKTLALFIFYKQQPQFYEQPQGAEVPLYAQELYDLGWLLRGLAAARRQTIDDIKSSPLWNQAYALYEEANPSSTSDPAPASA